MECGVPGCSDNGDRKLRELREMYEPYLNGLSRRLLMPVPGWGVEKDSNPNRLPTVWERITSQSANPQPAHHIEKDHL